MLGEQGEGARSGERIGGGGRERREEEEGGGGEEGGGRERREGRREGKEGGEEGMEGRWVVKEEKGREGRGDSKYMHVICPHLPILYCV